MTIAALSPLFTWWPLALVVLGLIVTVARRVAPVEIEYSWMPPHPRLYPVPGGRRGLQCVALRADWPPPWTDAAIDRLVAAVRADPWGPPDAWTRVA